MKIGNKPAKRKETTIVERVDPESGNDQVKGLGVYGSDDQKIGTVDEVLTDATAGRRYFLVKSGLLGLGTDTYYIPESAVELVGSERVVLNMTKNDVEAQGWMNPPNR